jgi:DNA-binding MarR family transcriptional regulator
VRSKKDRRVVLIRLTDRGKSLARQIPVAPMQIFSDALSALTTEERDDLRRLLRKVTDHLHARVQNKPSNGD